MLKHKHKQKQEKKRKKIDLISKHWQESFFLLLVFVYIYSSLLLFFETTKPFSSCHICMMWNENETHICEREKLKNWKAYCACLYLCVYKNCKDDMRMNMNIYVFTYSQNHYEFSNYSWLMVWLQLKTKHRHFFPFFFV